ncbi:hypothetical protein BN946_scf184662.g10 [Trametes cinnabarina]|uniref:Integrase catalytic domain-containing protein n=1 Tax=Pycnoporus cinnabarinus TaxID=5643 RepID=A0A060S563_PYCCI|nr:hypothetical protein BN946_scf184662.g10 [Trametes cinnabarina]
MEDLKQALLESPALHAINYKSPVPVILAVDTSYIAVGYHLAQCDEQKPQIHYYSRFGSITLNERESHFSQPKLELCGLFHALQATKLYLIGICNLVVKVDARSIKGMLNNPDLAPSASMNRWILAILTFHFRLAHVPGTLHGPDSLTEDGHDFSGGEEDDEEDEQATRAANRTTIPIASETEAANFAEPEGKNFFSDDRKLWQKSTDGAHKLMVWPEKWLDILRAAHDHLGHRGRYVTSQFVGKRFWWPTMQEDVVCSAFLSAVRDLEKCFNLHHIKISPYNSKANSIVERSHFDMRQVLFKAADGDQKPWSQVVHYAFWAERVTVCKQKGCSLYFAVTGCHPVLPMDIAEVTYLSPPPTSLLSSGELIARRAIKLQKRHDQLSLLKPRVYHARIEAAKKFKRDHPATIRNFDFKPGTLVLMRYTQIEKSLNWKMQPHYTGPLVMVSQNRGGTYVLCELDESVLHRTIAAFCLVPYLLQKVIALPPGFANISKKRLDKLISSEDDKEPKN